MLDLDFVEYAERELDVKLIKLDNGEYEVDGYLDDDKIN